MKRAFQIRDYPESVTDCSSRTLYITHFNCKMEEADNRKLSPWMLERSLAPKYMD